MDALAQVVVWLNAVANALGSVLLAPIGVLPGWLSATIIAAATGLLMLIIFKYTSHQRAIKAVRNDIKAQLLALKLFKDSMSVTFRAQGCLLLDAFWLLILALVPMLVMAVPVSLLLVQLALWYQSRPLRVGEETVLTVKLNGDESSWPRVQLQPTDALAVTIGPVRVLSKRELCWNIKARENGYHRVVFQVDDQTIHKELAIGDGCMRVPTQRPGWNWSAALLHPWEPPFGPDSAVQSIEIDYPKGTAWTIGGIEPWVIYWFVVSMVAALCCRRLLNVSI
jgi:hypothetical protein